MGLAILFFYLALLDCTKIGLTDVGFALCTASCSLLMSEAALLLFLFQVISSSSSFPCVYICTHRTYRYDHYVFIIYLMIERARLFRETPDPGML